MNIRLLIIPIAFVCIAPCVANGQYIEKVTFDSKDSTGGYYITATCNYYGYTGS